MYTNFSWCCKMGNFHLCLILRKFVHTCILLVFELFWETDKQRICVNTQLKKWFMQLEFKERYSYADGKICTQTNFRVRYRGFWARRHICNCHYIAVSVAKTFTLPIKLFNKRLACLNDHCLKMVSCGRWKGTVSKYTEKKCYP